MKWTPFYGDYAMLTMDAKASLIIKVIIVSAVFIAVIGVITYRIFRKAEIK